MNSKSSSTKITVIVNVILVVIVLVYVFTNMSVDYKSIGAQRYFTYAPFDTAEKCIAFATETKGFDLCVFTDFDADNAEIYSRKYFAVNGEYNATAAVSAEDFEFLKLVVAYSLDEYSEKYAVLLLEAPETPEVYYENAGAPEHYKIQTGLTSNNNTLFEAVYANFYLNNEGAGEFTALLSQNFSSATAYVSASTAYILCGGYAVVYFYGDIPDATKEALTEELYSNLTLIGEQKDI